MAYSVLLSRAAEGDRDRIVEYLLEHLANRQAALHFMSQVDAVVESLETFPLGFPQCEEPRLAAMGYRMALFSEMSYVAVFRVKGTSVTVARIFHTRQDYAQLL
jgi:plasmid stabilization system protein ParE